MKWRALTIGAEGRTRASERGVEVSIEATPAAATARSEDPAAAGIPSIATAARIIDPTIATLGPPALNSDLRMMLDS